MHSSSTTLLLSLYAAHLSLCAFCCSVVLMFARGLAQRRVLKMLLMVLRGTWI